MSFLITSLICSSMMVPGFVSYGVLYALEKKRENLAVFLFTGVMLCVGVSRTVSLFIAYTRPDLVASYRWNLVYEACLLFFFPAIPFFLSSILTLGPTGKRINRAFHRTGWLLALVFLLVILIDPSSYLQPLPTEGLPHPMLMGRGVFRPASYVSMTFLFLYVFYTLAISFSTWKQRSGNSYMTILVVGLVVSIMMLLGEFFEVYTGRYPSPFPKYAFPRTLTALSVFTLTAMISMTQKTAAEARETARDRAEVKKKRDELAMVAYYDAMTGYKNRSALFLDIQRNCTPPFHILLADIDNLAYVNGYHGYDAGDSLIRSVGRVCERLKATDAELYRIDADAFAVLARGTMLDMEALAAEILLHIRDIVVPGADDVRFTASIGVAGAENGITPETWLNRVNTALERAKKGRNRFVTFDPELHEDERRRQEIISGMRRSLDESGFRMFYQPIVTHDLRTVGAEALVRWEHPRLGPVGPEEFIPLAEGTGLITRLTRFVIEAALDDFCGDASMCLDMRVNINLSGRDVADRNLLTGLKTLSDGRGCGMLGFEVTETDMIADKEQSVRNLFALRDAGYTVALDDFGTGYSSLSYLNDLPLDKLKIDRTFIANLPDDTRKSVLLDAIIRLGRDLDLDLIVEGVENERQFEFLKKRDCRYFQGFFFAPPMAVDDFRKWMGRQPEAAV